MSWRTPQNLITELTGKYEDAREYFNECWVDLLYAEIANNGDNFKLAITYLISAIDYNTFGSYAMLNRHTADVPNYAVPYFFQHYNAGEIDMMMIINTMLEATPDEIFFFTGIEDAYRQSLWDKPYDVNFFAGLAKRFEQWG